MAASIIKESAAEQQQRPRSPSLEKYRKVEKPRGVPPDDEIRVTGTGRVGKYVTYADKLFKEQEKQSVTIRATGKAVAIAVSVCEVLKRRFKGLHQLTSIGWIEIIDEYEPLEEGLENRIEKRTVPSITILLTKDELTVDKNGVGYQPPLDESLIEERDTDELARPARPRRNPRRRSNPDADRNKSDALPDGIQDHPRRGRGRGGGRGRGRGRGRGYRGNNSRRMSNMNLQGQVMA